MSGGRVLGGGDDGVVRVWDVETLELAGEPTKAGGGKARPVRAVVADAGEVWVSVGREVAMWGRRRKLV